MWVPVYACALTTPLRTKKGKPHLFFGFWHSYKYDLKARASRTEVACHNRIVNVELSADGAKLIVLLIVILSQIVATAGKR